MTTLARAREVGDFILAHAYCLPCQNAGRRNRAELDEVILAALSVEPESNHARVGRRLADRVEWTGLGSAYVDGPRVAERVEWGPPAININGAGLSPEQLQAAVVRAVKAGHEPEPSRDERTFGTLGAAALLVVGFLLGLFWVWVSGWAFR